MNGRSLGTGSIGIVREVECRARTLTVDELGEFHPHRPHRLTDGYIQELLLTLTSSIR